MNDATKKLMADAEAIVKRPNNTKLCDALMEIVASLTLAGATARTVAAYLKISDRTYRNWMKWGREQKGDLYEKFYLTVKAAESQTAFDMAQVWMSEGKRDWKAARAILESRWPEDWGQGRRRKPDRPQLPQAPVVINVTLTNGQSLMDAVPREYLPLVSMVEPRALEV